MAFIRSTRDSCGFSTSVLMEVSIVGLVVAAAEVNVDAHAVTIIIADNCSILIILISLILYLPE